MQAAGSRLSRSSGSSWTKLLAALLFVVGSVLPAQVCAQTAEPNTLVREAVAKYGERKYEEVLALLRQALQLAPDHVDALYYTGLTQMALGQPREAVEPLERARALSPSDVAIEYQLGVALFAIKDYKRAEPLLEDVFRRQPTADNVGYYVGFMLYGKGEYRAALDAFRVNVSRDPAFQQLTRFFTGLALSQLGLSSEAASELDAAVGLNPGSAVTGPAERLRERVIGAPRPDQRFQAEARVGMLYDTNAPVLPNPSQDPTAEAARQHRSETVGELLSFQLQYAWLRNGPWEATAAYTFFGLYANDLPSFGIVNNVASTGVSYRNSLGSMAYLIGLGYSFDHFMLGGSEFLVRHTAALSATLVENEAHVSAIELQLQSKDFAEERGTPSAEIRDALNWLIGIGHVFRFAADRHYVRLGYQFDVENARGGDFSYLGHRFLIGGQYTLPWGRTRLKYDFDAHLRDYTHRHAFLPEVAPDTRKRADSELTHTVRVEQPLPRGFTLVAEYQAIMSRSNLALYSFDRQLYSLSLVWKY